MDSEEITKIRAGGCTFRFEDAKDDGSGRFAIATTAGRHGPEAMANTLRCPKLFGSGAEVAFSRLSLAETLEELERQLPQLRNAKEVIFLGKSGGGYVASALAATYAAMRAPRRVRAVAFNPPTQVWPPDEGRRGKVYLKMMKRSKRGDPGYLRRLEEEGDLKPLIERVAATPNADFKFTIISGSRNPRDFRHAQRIEGLPGVRQILCDTDQHKIYWWLDVPVDDPVAIQRAIDKWRRAKMYGENVEPDDLDEMDDTGADRSQPDEEMIAAILKFRQEAPSLEALLAD